MELFNLEYKSNFYTKFYANKRWMNKRSSTAIQYTDNALIRKETFELKLTNLRKK